MGNPGQMSFLSAKTVILGVEFCYLCLCLTGPIPAAETVGTTEIPIFEPGKEYRVETDNKAIGTKSFNVYVPLDYTDDRDWPVIFRYMARADKYNPVLCREPRMMTCDRGAIVVGMGYLKFKSGKKKMTISEYRNSIKRELKSIYEVKKLISKHFRLDNNRLFISGSSAGGWLAANLLEYRSQPWSGALIFGAGRDPDASLLTNKDSLSSFRGMPIFFGSSPEGSHGPNHKWALRAAALYELRGSIVTFETYGRDDPTCSPLLRDWTRAYILADKTDFTRDKIAKARQLTRTKLEEINSTEIIKKQIAKQLNKPAQKLSTDDLIKIKELSLMGENVSDTAYITNLINLESLDISFTYVDNVEPLLNCKHLQKLNISGTRIKNIKPLKDLPRLDSLSMWDLWLDREQINGLKENLPNLKITDYQWDIYEKDSIGRVLPKLTVKIN
jgi:hypothetical protein